MIKEGGCVTTIREIREGIVRGRDGMEVEGGEIDVVVGIMSIKDG